MGELEVAAFTAYLRTDEELRAVGLGKPRSIAVAIDEGQALVEERDFRVRQFLERAFDRENLSLRLTDEEELGGPVLVQHGDKPFNAGIFLERVPDNRISLLRLNFPRDTVDKKFSRILKRRRA
jgi:hypothetical protein